MMPRVILALGFVFAAATAQGMRVGLFHWPRYDLALTSIADDYRQLSYQPNVDILVREDVIEADQICRQVVDDQAQEPGGRTDHGGVGVGVEGRLLRRDRLPGDFDDLERAHQALGVAVVDPGGSLGVHHGQALVQRPRPLGFLRLERGA